MCSKVKVEVYETSEKVLSDKNYKARIHKFSKNTWSHFKTKGARRVTFEKGHSEDRQITYQTPP
jgi:hypothetical protein